MAWDCWVIPSQVSENGKSCRKYVMNLKIYHMGSPYWRWKLYQAHMRFQCYMRVKILTKAHIHMVLWCLEPLILIDIQAWMLSFFSWELQVCMKNIDLNFSSMKQTKFYANIPCHEMLHKSCWANDMEWSNGERTSNVAKPLMKKYYKCVMGSQIYLAFPSR